MEWARYAGATGAAADPLEPVPHVIHKGAVWRAPAPAPQPAPPSAPAPVSVPRAPPGLPGRAPPPRLTVSVTTLLSQMQSKQARRESPLDLSVKTVKNSADSTATAPDELRAHPPPLPRPAPRPPPRPAPSLTQPHKVDFAPDFRAQYYQYLRAPGPAPMAAPAPSPAHRQHERRPPPPYIVDNRYQTCSKPEQRVTWSHRRAAAAALHAHAPAQHAPTPHAPTPHAPTQHAPTPAPRPHLALPPPRQLQQQQQRLHQQNQLQQLRQQRAPWERRVLSILRDSLESRGPAPLPPPQQQPPRPPLPPRAPPTLLPELIIIDDAEEEEQQTCRGKPALAPASVLAIAPASVLAIAPVAPAPLTPAPLPDADVARIRTKAELKVMPPSHAALDAGSGATNITTLPFSDRCPISSSLDIQTSFRSCLVERKETYKVARSQKEHLFAQLRHETARASSPPPTLLPAPPPLTSQPSPSPLAPCFSAEPMNIEEIERDAVRDSVPDIPAPPAPSPSPPPPHSPRDSWLSACDSFVEQLKASNHKRKPAKRKVKSLSEEASGADEGPKPKREPEEGPIPKSEPDERPKPKCEPDETPKPKREPHEEPKPKCEPEEEPKPKREPCDSSADPLDTASLQSAEPQQSATSQLSVVPSSSPAAPVESAALLLPVIKCEPPEEEETASLPAEVKMECFEDKSSKENYEEPFQNFENLDKDIKVKKKKPKLRKREVSNRRLKPRNIKKEIKRNVGNSDSESGSSDEDAPLIRSVQRRLLRSLAHKAPYVKLECCEAAAAAAAARATPAAAPPAPASDRSHFRPGWQAEVARYKAALRMPPSLLPPALRPLLPAPSPAPSPASSLAPSPEALPAPARSLPDLHRPRPRPRPSSFLDQLVRKCARDPRSASAPPPAQSAPPAGRGSASSAAAQGTETRGAARATQPRRPPPTLRRTKRLVGNIKDSLRSARSLRRKDVRRVVQLRKRKRACKARTGRDVGAGAGAGTGTTAGSGAAPGAVVRVRRCVRRRYRSGLDYARKRRRGAAGASGVGAGAARALCEAARAGALGTARALLQRGAPPDTPGPRGRTPMHEAAAHAHLEMMRLLAAYGAPVRSQGEALLRLCAGSAADAGSSSHSAAAAAAAAAAAWVRAEAGGGAWLMGGAHRDVAAPAHRPLQSPSPPPSPPPPSPPPVAQLLAAPAPLPPLYALPDQPDHRYLLLTDVAHYLQMKSREGVVRLACGTGAGAGGAGAGGGRPGSECVRDMALHEFLEQAQSDALLGAGEKINVRASRLTLLRLTPALRLALRITEHQLPL